MPHRSSPLRCLSRLPLLTALALTAACSGGEPATGPGEVARVDVSAAGSTTMNPGQTRQLTARYYDAQSSQLDGRSVTWSTSSAPIASVTVDGLVTANAPGLATITATVDGVKGSLGIEVALVPVAHIIISPPSPTVRQGESLTLTAQPNDASGNPLTDRTVTWSSADPSRATVTSLGVVTGVTPGYVYIRASADSRTDSVSLRVRNLFTPTITDATAGELVPGANATITGTHFGEAVADNTIYVNGAPAAITSASATSVDFVIPSKSQLPCTSTGSAQVLLLTGGDTAAATITLRVATERQLDVGASLLLTSQADLLCNEFIGDGGRYLITAFNHATEAATRVSFKLTGSAQPPPRRDGGCGRVRGARPAHLRQGPPGRCRKPPLAGPQRLHGKGTGARPPARLAAAALPDGDTWPARCAARHGSRAAACRRRDALVPDASFARVGSHL